jgi:hypothetical protein
VQNEDWWGGVSSKSSILSRLERGSRKSYAFPDQLNVRIQRRIQQWLVLMRGPNQPGQIGLRLVAPFLWIASCKTERFVSLYDVSRLSAHLMSDNKKSTHPMRSIFCGGEPHALSLVVPNTVTDHPGRKALETGLPTKQEVC